MKLDVKGYALLHLLDEEYGKLSNVPDDHPYINIIMKTYGKDNSKSKMTKRLYIRCPKRMWAEVQVIAKELEMTRADLVRTWVSRYLKRPYKLKPINEGHHTNQSKTSLYVHETTKEQFDEAMTKINGIEFKAMNSIIYKNIRDFHNEEMYF